MQHIELNLFGTLVNALSKGGNFTIAISRDEAQRVLLSDTYHNAPFDIMCKEAGDNGQWLGIELSDLDNDEDKEYQTFEIWLLDCHIDEDLKLQIDALPAAPPIDTDLYIAENYDKITFLGMDVFIHKSGEESNDLAAFALHLNNILSDGATEGFAINDIQSLYYLNDWVFFKPKSKEHFNGDFTMFAYRDFESNPDIREIEKSILSETV